MTPPNTEASDWLGLSAHVAVVTGAASGIGAAITRSLAQAGAHVALLDLDAGGAEALAQDICAAGGTAGSTSALPRAISSSQCSSGCEDWSSPLSDSSVRRARRVVFSVRSV